MKRLTGLAMPALLLSANLPDIDVLGLFFGATLAWRRGWTHGPLALVALPALLAFALVAFDRWQSRRGTRPAARPPVRLTPLLVLCYVGATSHLLLDYLNTYGIRLLMPFSERWFYGDTIFIIDPWIWLALGVGVWASRRRTRSAATDPNRPALRSLVAVAIYTAGMGAAGRAAEHIVRREIDGSGTASAGHVVASPVFADPLRREVVVETAAGYRFGDFRWTPQPLVRLEDQVVARGMDDPAIVEAAARDRQLAGFLYWSRFPFATVDKTGCGTTVTLNDARYSRRAGSGPFRIRVQLPADSTVGVPGASCPG